LVGSRLLSRSGAQLYARDRFHKGRPLLEVMSEHGTSFRNALEAFDRVDLYANAVKDTSGGLSLSPYFPLLADKYAQRTVPFPTAAITTHDPFAYAMQKARERKAYDPAADIDLRDGGLEVVLNPKYSPLISEVRAVDPPSQDDDDDKRRRRSHRCWRPPRLFVPLFFADSDSVLGLGGLCDEGFYEKMIRKVFSGAPCGSSSLEPLPTCRMRGHPEQRILRSSLYVDRPEES
jgi:hypothetical protein